MKKIDVDLSQNGSYDILIGYGVLDKIVDDLKETPIGNKYCVITDSTVNKLYGMSMLKKLKEAGLKTYLIEVQPGEKSKTLNTVAVITRKLISKGFNRKSAIIALGGGVVGDLAGFIASIYMRGIPYIQIPTTIMAQVDSSVGGKTGINMYGKNIIGTFYQPKRVYSDLNMLHTLPKREIKNGLVEIIKTAVVFDEKVFNYLERNIEKIINLESRILLHIISKTVQIKVSIVKKDPKEQNLRAILNYGHTLGHVLEILSGHKLKHGEAVAIGMRFAGLLSYSMGLWSREELNRQNRLLDKLILPPMPHNITPKMIIHQMHSDKKIDDKKINFILPRRIGEIAVIDGKYKTPVAENELIKLLCSFNVEKI